MPLEPPPEVLVVLPLGPGPSFCSKPLNLFGMGVVLLSAKLNLVSGGKLVYGPLSRPSVVFAPELHRIVSRAVGVKMYHD